MINPGVITLADANNTEYSRLPYRFCIEDNIGESIHIHYKDIRLDLTVSEFERLAEKIGKIVDDMVTVEGFSCKNFDARVLVGISANLPNLEKIETREVFLEDILVDTFDENGRKIFAPIYKSRVFKALCNIPNENDAHTIQLNYQKSTQSPEKMSNAERIEYNLMQIKEHGYPYKNQLITIDKDNKINDGQHRAACLYYLYGNIKVTVQTLIWKDSSHTMNDAGGETWQKTEFELFEKARLHDELSKKQAAENESNIIQARENSFMLKLKRFIKFPIKLFFWCTWRKADKVKLEIIDRLSYMEKKENELIERAIHIEEREVTIEKKENELIERTVHIDDKENDMLNRLKTIEQRLDEIYGGR